MTERERLVEIIQKYEFDATQCNYCQKDDDECPKCSAECMADYLLQNGVICPPCKVGDNVYVIDYCHCSKPEFAQSGKCWKRVSQRTPQIYGKVSRIKYQNKLVLTKDSLFETEVKAVPSGTICHLLRIKQFRVEMYNQVGKTVFLTREEAEKALEEREHDNT